MKYALALAVGLTISTTAGAIAKDTSRVPVVDVLSSGVPFLAKETGRVPVVDEPPLPRDNRLDITTATAGQRDRKPYCSLGNSEYRIADPKSDYQLIFTDNGSDHEVGLVSEKANIMWVGYMDFNNGHSRTYVNLEPFDLFAGWKHPTLMPDPNDLTGNVAASEEANKHVFVLYELSVVGKTLVQASDGPWVNESPPPKALLLVGLGHELFYNSSDTGQPANDAVVPDSDVFWFYRCRLKVNGD